VLIVRETTLELKTCDLNYLLFASAENTDTTDLLVAQFDVHR
jgi:hypothetical protein